MNVLATLINTSLFRWILRGCDVNAIEFNKKHKVGGVFIHHAHPALRGGHIVKTVGIARDFDCGAIVEINQEPYFVKINTLKAAS